MLSMLLIFLGSIRTGYRLLASTKDQNINNTWFLSTFYQKIAPNAGFVNVVHVVLLMVFENVLKTRVLLMLLIFFGNYVEESDHSSNRSEID